MICMKKVRFSSRPRAKVGAWGQQAQLKHRAVSSFKNNHGLVALLLQIIYCKWCLQQSLYLIPPCLYLQGVPKVRSANLMHYNFWSKLYFSMKFLEDVYFSIKYMCSEFQWLACPFCFFITFCSFFITWCAGFSSTPKHILSSLGSWKKNLFWVFIQKR